MSFIRTVILLTAAGMSESFVQSAPHTLVFTDTALLAELSSDAPTPVISPT